MGQMSILYFFTFFTDTIHGRRPLLLQGTIRSPVEDLDAFDVVPFYAGASDFGRVLKGSCKAITCRLCYNSPVTIDRRRNTGI
jgi:hypothetical protein